MIEKEIFFFNYKLVYYCLISNSLAPSTPPMSFLFAFSQGGLQLLARPSADNAAVSVL